MKKRTQQIVVVSALLVILAGSLFLITMDQRKDNDLACPAFQYDIGSLQDVDPALVKWEEVMTISLPFTMPRAVAMGPDDAICTAGDKTVVVFDKEGKQTLKVDLDGAVRCVAVDADGTFFFGMPTHVEVYSADGQKKATWESLGKRAIITSIAVGEKNVYVADAGNKIVVRYDKSGKMLGRIGEKDKARGIKGFVVPSPYFDLAIDDGDKVWIVDPGRHMLGQYRPDGDLISSWRRSSSSIEGFCGCCNPAHIALRENGSFVTGEKGIVRVKIHKPTGDFDSVVVPPADFKEGMTGPDLAVDSQDRILVLDTAEKTLRVFTERK